MKKITFLLRITGNKTLSSFAKQYYSLLLHTANVSHFTVYVCNDSNQCSGALWIRIRIQNTDPDTH